VPHHHLGVKQEGRLPLFTLRKGRFPQPHPQKMITDMGSVG